MCIRDRVSTQSTWDCVVCPSNVAICQQGRVWPMPGWWRVNSTSDQNFQACPRREACPNVIETSNQPGDICAANHEGNLCASCKQGYAHNNLRNPCTKCQFSFMEMGTILILIIQLILIALQITTNIEVSRNFNEMCERTKIDAEQLAQHDMNINDRVLTAGIKIVITYSQILSLALGLVFASEESSDLRVIRFSFDCFFQSSDDLTKRAEQIIWWRTFSSVVAFICMVMIAAIICVVLRAFKKIKTSTEMINKMMNCWVVFFFSVQPAILKGFLELYNCTDLGDGRLFLSSAPDVQCWVGEHSRLYYQIALPSLILSTRAKRLCA
eukprot:TRINITY_DN7788_c0_g1_i4.p1 TRINITY_DN7788_c0_g1~~TRINITY_DN7788_c0_g1_i4.p1  ORF type:complete len:346 (+),score=63.87 TRINITY_DN7788_c0_g1_i4:61-1038(+)